MRQNYAAAVKPATVRGITDPKDPA